MLVSGTYLWVHVIAIRFGPWSQFLEVDLKGVAGFDGSLVVIVEFQGLCAKMEDTSVWERFLKWYFRQ
jgi:hypothetical protein